MRRLLALTLVCLAFASAAAEPLRIVTLGDSITKGVRPGVKPEETFAARLEAALQTDGVAVSVVNVGIGSERTDLALKRLVKDVIAQKPAVVTIMYGTNDSYVDQGKSASRITSLWRSIAQISVNSLTSCVPRSTCRPSPNTGNTVTARLKDTPNFITNRPRQRQIWLRSMN